MDDLSYKDIDWSDIEEIEIQDKPTNIEDEWKFVTIYKFDVHGNKRLWQICFDGEKLWTRHGVYGGKLQVDPIDVTLNKSKKTLGQLAYQEATNRYIKYIRDGYQAPGATQAPLVKAMKGNKFRIGVDKYATNKIKLWPVAVDPKLDGVRFIIVNLGRGHIEGRTWTNIIYYHMNHILDDVRALFDFLPPYSALDGELYIHGVSFYTLLSIIRSDKNIHPNLKDLEYHIYDLAIESVPFEERKKLLQNAYERFIETGNEAKHFSIVPSYLAYNLDDILDIHEELVEMGYEGSVVKKLSNGTDKEYLREQSFYKFNKRCDNVLKLKDVDDDEFEIVDVITATGRNAGTGIFVLKTKNGEKTFNCAPMGDEELRREYLLSRKTLKGKLATVVYESINEKTGIPRNAKVKEIRDYE